MEDKKEFWDQHTDPKKFMEMSPKESHLYLVKGILGTSMPKLRWCMKNDVTTHIRNLQGGSFKCWKCKYHGTWGETIDGICDPI